MGVSAVDASPAQMIREPWGLRSAGQLLQSLQVFTVERLCGAEVHRDAVLDDPVLVQDLVECLESAASVDHVVFGDDLEPVDDGLLRENMFIVRNAKTDPHPVVGKSIEA